MGKVCRISVLSAVFFYTLSLNAHGENESILASTVQSSITVSGFESLLKNNNTTNPQIEAYLPQIRENLLILTYKQQLQKNQFREGIKGHFLKDYKYGLIMP